MENLQYVQKKMTISFNRKYTSNVTYSVCFLHTYIIYKYPLVNTKHRCTRTAVIQSPSIQKKESLLSCSPIQNSF